MAAKALVPSGSRSGGWSWLMAAMIASAPRYGSPGWLPWLASKAARAGPVAQGQVERGDGGVPRDGRRARVPEAPARRQAGEWIPR